MDVALSLVGGVLLVAVIIAVNGYFVAQEFSYMAVDRSRLKARADDGDKAARRALKITEKTSFMLSGAQLGITVTGLLVGYVAEPLIGSAIGEVLGGVGVPSGVGIAVGTVAVLVVATFTQMLFGELFPKNYAIARPYETATALSASTRVYMRTMGWAIRFFDASSARLVRLLGFEPVEDVEHSANIHDLERIVSVSRESGQLPPGLSLVLERMLDFPQRHVDHALVPRSRVDSVPAAATLTEVLAEMEGGHSRYPVLDEDGDVVGVVHLGDVLARSMAVVGEGTDPGTVTAADVARPAVVVPTLMTLPHALEAMAERHDQLACVIDEWGGFAGIVTAEDLLEEVVGEITDEHDEPEDPHLVPDPDGVEGRWTVRGDAPLDEVEREIGVELPEGAARTVAGMVIAARGALPVEGEHVDVELPLDPVELAHDDDPPRRLLRATVLEVTRYVPAQVRVELVAPEGLDAEDLDEPLDPVPADQAQV
ncbi:hemolysin family protein [Nocardioides bruguierae]|uniref:Hemolysin family protein n=1 Tax=Nocardioides bruguierae TaxID=2945102 RepID=A0A9X2DBY6_9ACTN|nr:hemolysin family protein [Nocardioides bruguierae]MCM0622789.1 hemolysin family protein [Nocardioides bruguierae]